MLVIVLAALCAPVLAADRAADASAAERAAAWIERRTAEIHAAEPAESARLAHATLREVHGRLVAEGFDPALADAFTPDVAEGAPTEREIRAIETARRRLHSFASASARPLPPVPAGARTEMERILQDPVFDLESRKASPLERLVGAVRRLLFGLLSTVMQTASNHATLVMVIVMAIIAAALLLIGSKLVRALRFGPRPSSVVRPAVLTSVPDGVDPEALIARARDLTAAGRGRTAMKLLEMASVVALRSRGDIPSDPGLTDLEAVSWLTERGGPQIRASFERLSTLHDGIVYGGREAAATAIEEAFRLARGLVAGAPETAS